MSLHPATEAILKYFEYAHLPHDLQQVSEPICDLAHDIAAQLDGSGPELTAGLRKLLEAKDCFVRAALDMRTEPPAGRAASLPGMFLDPPG